MLLTNSIRDSHQINVSNKKEGAFEDCPSLKVVVNDVNDIKQVISEGK